MRISDWSSDVCSSDLKIDIQAAFVRFVDNDRVVAAQQRVALGLGQQNTIGHELDGGIWAAAVIEPYLVAHPVAQARSEEHTSELQSLMRISYAVFCFKKKSTTPQELIHPPLPSTLAVSSAPL